MNNYSDYVIKDGKHIGKYEEMYQNCEDPWNQNSSEKYSLAKEIMIKLVLNNGFKKIIEIGTGFGYLANRIAHASPDSEVVATDVSKTAIKKAKELYKRDNLKFEVADLMKKSVYDEFKPDVILMPEVSWCVLEHLKTFLGYLKVNHPDVTILHSVTFYPKGDQKYGVEYFTDTNSVMKFFDMKYSQHGEITDSESGVYRSFFMGTFK